MPLPFMKNKSVAGLIISQRKPDGTTEPEESNEEQDQGLDACSEALIRAIHSKDAKAVSSALRDIQELIDVDEPSESESSESPHTYAAQNIKAAKDKI